MITLRCTRKLAKRLTLTPGVEAQQPTNKLGDWYANLLNVGHRRLIHCVSERSLLSIVLPAKDVRHLPSRVPDAVRSLLSRLDAPADIIETEVIAMLPVSVGLTCSRSVVGSMIDLGWQAELHLAADCSDLGDLELALAGAPCLRLALDPFPFRAAGSLLGAHLSDPARRVLH